MLDSGDGTTHFMFFKTEEWHLVLQSGQVLGVVATQLVERQISHVSHLWLTMLFLEHGDFPQWVKNLLEHSFLNYKCIISRAYVMICLSRIIRT